jgi:DNA-binding Xre family transcriptional regulator
MTITTKNTLTVLLGKRQMTTGERWTLRRLADVAGVPKDLVYRLDAGVVRYLDLDALERLCTTLLCRPEEILAWDNNGGSSSPDKDAV